MITYCAFMLAVVGVALMIWSYRTGPIWAAGVGFVSGAFGAGYLVAFAVSPAFAMEGARAPDASPALMDAALQAAIVQRDQALNEGIRLSARLTLAQREIARLRKELEDTRKGAASPEEAPPAESPKP